MPYMGVSRFDHCDLDQIFTLTMLRLATTGERPFSFSLFVGLCKPERMSDMRVRLHLVAKNARNQQPPPPPLG